MDNSRQQFDALLNAQKEYWQSLADGQNTPTPEQWADFISTAQKNINQDTPKQFSQLLDLLGAHARNFTQYGEQLLNQFRSSESQGLEEAALQFQNYIQQQTGEILLQQWQLPEQFASLFKTHSFHDDLLFDNPFTSGLKSLLETPVVGSHQESQQQFREALKLLLEYQEALHEYIGHYGAINQQAVSSMISTLAKSEKRASGLQQLHDIWVDQYEKAYAEQVSKDEYQRSHGRISNALMQLRKYVQEIRDVQFQQLGLATRRGLDTALQRQHQLRKEMRSSKREQQQLSNTIENLKQQHTEQLSQLQQEISAMKEELILLRKELKRDK